jgi:type II secretory pathway component PulJ
MKQVRPGYTLLEFLAAVLLASVVLASSLLAVRTISRAHRETLTEEKTSDTSLPHVFEMLEHDFANAVRFEVGAHRLTLFRSDVDDRSPPILRQIEYRIETCGQYPCLFRMTNESSKGQTLVLVGINRFDVTIAEPDGWPSPMVVFDKKSRPNSDSIERSIHEDPVRVLLKAQGVAATSILFPRGVR